MAPSEDRPRTGPARWTATGSHGSLSGYGLALGALAAALLFRYLVRDSLGVKVPYLQFYPAILLAAWYGGLGPGVLTTTLAAFTAMYFFLPPDGPGRSGSLGSAVIGDFRRHRPGDFVAQSPAASGRGCATNCGCHRDCSRRTAGRDSQHDR